MIKKALVILFLASTCFADQVAISAFKGLNNNESSLIIDPGEAQDLLNVDVTAGGKSIKKRPGYGIYKTLPTTQGLHGGFHAFDSSGNDYQLWSSSTSIYGIVSDGTATQLVSSATLNSTLDCADTQGSSYCADSNRDFYIKTNGSTLQSWATSPLGTMVEATPDRMVVAGVSASPNTLFISGSNSFSTFTTGPLTTDPFNEVIAAPGSKLTHIRWACGKLLWWKDQSFGYFAFEDQFAAQVKIVSDNIGTFDNTSAVDPGGSVWFRGQDGHIWQYDCSGLLKQSIEITPLVQASGRRTSNNFTQTTQSDFQAGSSSPTNPSQPLSFTINPGAVVPGSFTVTENSSASGWGSGTSSNMAVGTSSISLSVNNSGTVTDPSFESSTGAGPIIYSFSSDWTVITNYAPGLWISVKTLSNGAGCTLNPQSGTYYGHASGTSSIFQVIDAAGSTGDSATVLASQTLTQTNDCTWTAYTLTSTSDKGKRVKFQIKNTVSGQANNYIVTTTSYIFGGSISFYGNESDNSAGHGPGGAGIDNITNGSSTITSGFFNSQAFNTNLPFAYVYSSATYSANTSTPTFLLEKATATTGPWTAVATSTNSNSQVNNGKYLRYTSTISVTGADNALTSITGAQLVAMSSGTYFTQWKSAPSLAAWSTFNPTTSDGDGSHSFFIRSSTSPQAVLNSTVAWVAQTANSLVTVSTGTGAGVYFQIIDSFTITSATGTAPAINDLVVNWFEGTATDQAYMRWFDNAIWASVSYGVGVSSNTYIFKRDLINDGWTAYNFGAGGLLIQNNHLFFGDVASTGKIFEYDSGTSDNGNAISAYWKSRDFSGADPFLQNQLTQIDVLGKQNSGQSLTLAYSLDTSTTTTSYTIDLSTTSRSYIQSRKSVPTGKNGYIFNLKFSDNTATSAWEILGYRIGFNQQAYRPSQ